MFNTPVNISAGPFYYFYCVREIHIGTILNYTAVLLCLLLGTPAHCWLLWLSLHAGCKIKPTQVFPLTLTAMDLLFCLQLSSETLNVFTFQNMTMSYLTMFIFGLSWCCRLLIQTCVCVEQYLAVIFPVIFLRYKGAQYRIALAAAVWLMSSGYGLLLATAVVIFPDYIFLSACFTGVIVISSCCMSVLRALKHPGPGGREITKGTGRDVRNQQKRNAFKTISTVLFMVLLSYIPMASIAIFYLFEIDFLFFACDIVPVMISFNITCVMIAPLLNLYKEGYLKCIHNFLKLKLFCN